MQDGAAELLDIREAAEFLRVSETSLRRWTNAGRLPCLRIGGRHERRFRRDDLLAFIGVADRAAPSRAHNHFCALYTSDLERVRGASGFLTQGLQADALCLFAATRDVQAAVIAQLEYDRPAIRTDATTARLLVGAYHASAAARVAQSRVPIRAALNAGPAPSAPPLPLLLQLLLVLLPLPLLLLRKEDRRKEARKRGGRDPHNN